MGLAYIEGAGGGGVRSSDVTASAADILSGKTDLTAQSDDEVVQGTMPNNGTVNHSLPINGSFTIAQGYHSGSGKVTQNITTKAAATYYATTSDQTIAAGRYLSGAQTIKKLTQTNLSGGNIKPGVTVTVNNGNANVFSVTGSMASKAAATYYATTSDQTIAAGQYLSGAQTISKLTQTNLSGGNIKPGVTVKVNNGNSDVWSVTGTMASKAAATYYPSTSDQTIAKDQYLTGVQTIKAVTQQNLIASNIKKGVTVYVKNGNGNLFAVTGTFEGYVPSANSLYYYGQNIANFTFGGSSRKYATFGGTDIAVMGTTGSDNYVSYGFTSNTYQINGNSFSRLTITGDLFLSSNINGTTNGLNVYLDLVNSSTSYRIGTYRYTNTEHDVTLSSIVVPITNKTGSGYVRVWFQGFYISGSTDNTTLGYSLGNGTQPANIRTMVLS